MHFLIESLTSLINFLLLPSLKRDFLFNKLNLYEDFYHKTHIKIP